MKLKEQLIQKLFQNECSKKELNMLFELIQKDKEETAPEIMMTLLQKMSEVPALDSKVSERILGRVLAHSTDPKTTDKNTDARIKIRKQIIWIRSAAAVLIFVIASTFVFQSLNPSEINVRTGFGEQQSIELPDGSIVKLNANSSLTYKKHWDNQENREVLLQGEAFFEVEKKTETGQKFSVTTKDLTVQVLGTVFNVNSHQGATKVFLEEGEINLILNGLKEQMLMVPGELITYSETSRKLPEKRQALPALHTSWKDGLILFNDTPLNEILEKLEEIYGLTFHLKDSTNYDRTITTGLPVENLDEAVSILDETTDLQILKTNDGFIIQ